MEILNFCKLIKQQSKRGTGEVLYTQEDKRNFSVQIRDWEGTADKAEVPDRAQWKGWTGIWQEEVSHRGEKLMGFDNANLESLDSKLLSKWYNYCGVHCSDHCKSHSPPISGSLATPTCLTVHLHIIPPCLQQRTLHTCLESSPNKAQNSKRGSRILDVFQIPSTIWSHVI